MGEKTEKAWKITQEKIGIDILSIVMDLQSGRTSPGDTMDKILEHCTCFHESMMECENE